MESSVKFYGNGITLNGHDTICLLLGSDGGNGFFMKMSEDTATAFKVKYGLTLSANYFKIL